MKIKFDEWFGNWDQTKDPEVRRLCEIAWNVSLTFEREQFHKAMKRAGVTGLRIARVFTLLDK